MVTVIIFLDDRNNCKQYSAEKVCDMSLRAHYLLYYSMCLQIPIYYFFYVLLLFCPFPCGSQKLTQLFLGLLTLRPHVAYHSSFLTEAESQNCAKHAFKHPPEPCSPQLPASVLQQPPPGLTFAPTHCSVGALGGSVVKNLTAVQETQV